MKKNVAVISLDAYAGSSMPSRCRSSSATGLPCAPTVCGDGSVEHMPRKYDLYMVTTDAFDSWETCTAMCPSTGR